MYIGIGYKMYQISRLAFLYMEGYFPENDVDHINRISTDNRWNNLREVSPQCNSRNCNLSKKNKSKVTGVLWIKRDKKWLADIKINYKKIYIGYFKKKKDAVKARWEAEIKNNWPNCNSNSSAYLWLKKRNLI